MAFINLNTLLDKWFIIFKAFHFLLIGKLLLTKI